MTGPIGTSEGAGLSVSAVTRVEEVESLPLRDLSDFFNPFLRSFLTEALRCGGEVKVSRSGGGVDGLFLYHDVEKEASIFTRDRHVAEALYRVRDKVAVFSDFELEPGSEVYQILRRRPSRLVERPPIRPPSAGSRGE